MAGGTLIAQNRARGRRNFTDSDFFALSCKCWNKWLAYLNRSSWLAEAGGNGWVAGAWLPVFMKPGHFPRVWTFTDTKKRFVEERQIMVCNLFCMLSRKIHLHAPAGCVERECRACGCKWQSWSKCCIATKQWGHSHLVLSLNCCVSLNGRNFGSVPVYDINRFISNSLFICDHRLLITALSRLVGTPVFCFLGGGELRCIIATSEESRRAGALSHRLGIVVHCHALVLVPEVRQAQAPDTFNVDTL